MKRLLLLIALAALALPGNAAEGDGKLAVRLARALASAEAPALQPDGTLAIWIHFTDRGLSPAARDAALTAAAEALPDRTRRRRGKVRAPGTSLVDASDLPPAARYVDGVARTGARIRRQSRWFNAVSADATPTQIAAIAALPFVSRVDLVGRFRRVAPVIDAAAERTAGAAKAAAEEQPMLGAINYGGSLAGLQQINVPAVHALGLTGQGVVIGVLDTGFMTTHEALSWVTVLAQYDFVNDDPVVENEPDDPPGQHGHGTKTLSAVAGFRDNELVGSAYGASVILAKTEDMAGEYPQEEDNWVAGLEWVELLGADVVTSSLGYADWYAFDDLDGNTAVTTRAADLAVGRGVVVVNSAGNERGPGTNHIIAPADGDSVISVGAVDLIGDVAAFSSPGPTFDGRIKPDVVAQGVGTHVVALTDDQSYTTASGTSFSCPLVAGVAALVLSRAPTLTPLQVREALRETANQAGSPDNDVGWGVVDALAAVTYWGATIEHDPLPDSEDTVADMTVTARITDRLALDPWRMTLFWRADQGPWLAEPLVHESGDQYSARIAAQPMGTTVSYYFEVTDSVDITTSLPHAGGDAPFSFHVGQDTTPPAVSHTPLANQPIVIWPPAITATVTDNLGVGGVSLSYMVNAGPVQGPVPLSAAGAAFAVEFPLDVTAVAVNDRIAYTLTAWDLAGEPNSTQSGPYTFEVIETLGAILVLDDSGGAAVDLKFDRDKQAVPPRQGSGNGASMAHWLGEAGYSPTLMAAAVATADSLTGYQVVVLSAGDNAAPVADAELRATLRGWTQAGGRLLIEGGEIAYDALNAPGYPDFARDVLHAAAWRGDSAGSVQLVSGLGAHPLLSRPYGLPPTIPLTYDGYGDQDAVDPAWDAVTVMDSAGQPGAAGILVHDDNPAPESGQIVYLAFDIGAIYPATGRALVVNAANYLLAAEAPPSAAVAGTVLMADRSDPAGVVVSLTSGRQTITDANGQFSIDGLYAGLYTVVVARDGYATLRRQVWVSDGEWRGDMDFELRPAVTVQAATAPYLPIPDDSALGLTSVIQVAATGTVSEVTVDISIQHSWIGDLTVLLTSPNGTRITLHDRSGGTADDIVGNWPATLTVDGPGHPSDFYGEEINGDWTLFVSDTSADAAGILRHWGLQFLVPAPPTGAEDTPPATRLLGAHPNPFNPRTEMVFDLARSGPVRLDVFDLRGRLVRRLVARELPAGRHRATWDGRDDAGRELASGVYLSRLHATGEILLQKLTLVR